ncbi:MAG: GNAT family N-acetyltransferase [Lachnospiraceae bacterium]|nr:GNAT family N-acetyltransferase [Lachnospiraceae bacterium]
MNYIDYRSLQESEITRPLFRHFNRRQVVKDCWRRVGGEWVIREDPFIDDWSEEDYQFLVQCLRNTVNTGGVVYGAFENGQLKGFTSVEAQPLGSENQYLDLSCIHVSEDMRGQGIGTRLFSLACNWAREHGAKKLYISAHSAVETQSFYRAQGCVEAEEYNREHAEKEPYDCQMECVL